MTPEQRDVLNRIAARDNDWTDPTNAIRACLAELDAAKADRDEWMRKHGKRVEETDRLRDVIRELKEIIADTHKTNLRMSEAADAEIARLRALVPTRYEEYVAGNRTHIGWRVTRTNAKGEREYVHSLGGWGPIGHASHFYGLGHADEANKDAQQRGGRLVPVYLRVVKR